MLYCAGGAVQSLIPPVGNGSYTLSLEVSGGGGVIYWSSIAAAILPPKKKKDGSDDPGETAFWTSFNANASRIFKFSCQVFEDGSIGPITAG